MKVVPSLVETNLMVGVLRNGITYPSQRGRPTPYLLFARLWRGSALCEGAA